VIKSCVLVSLPVSAAELDRSNPTPELMVLCSVYLFCCLSLQLT
jgi:hypothetical protein